MDALTITRKEVKVSRYSSQRGHFTMVRVLWEVHQGGKWLRTYNYRREAKGFVSARTQ